MKFFTDIDLRRNELQNAVIQNLATHPPEPPKGFIYFNTTDNTYYGWNGIDWIDLGKLAAGDMSKSVYDRNDNDIVDKAENIDDGIYSSTAEEVRDAVTKKHTHSNKDLLDTYTQTEADLAEAVDNTHNHNNKDLLDTYTQTEADLADAVTKKHTKNDDQYLDYSGDNRVSASEIKEAMNELDAHKDNTNNPHQVTASQVGAAPTIHTHSGIDITSAVSEAENADTVDGKHATDFAPVTHTHSGSDITSAVSEAENATTVNDIYFRITEGVLEYSLDGTTYTTVQFGDMYKSTYDTDNDGIVDISEEAENADTVDGKHATDFAPTIHTHSGSDITSAVSEAENATTVNDIYFRINNGQLEFSTDGTTYTPVEGTGGSSGDMLKSVYDTNDDGVVDKAEAIDNGTYSATAQEIKDAVIKKHTQNTDTALGTMSADINMNFHKITNVTDPTSAQDVATKNYVDSKGMALDQVVLGVQIFS